MEGTEKNDGKGDETKLEKKRNKLEGERRDGKRVYDRVAKKWKGRQAERREVSICDYFIFRLKLP